MDGIGFMNRPLYVCFEGLDGSGKSTIFHYVKNELEQEGYIVGEICPTKTTCHCESGVACYCHNVEKLFHRFPYLHRSKFLRLFLFAHRSNDAARQVNQSSDIILGDRSVITSYICRWSSRQIFNRILIIVVNVMEYKIPSPDYVIYIDVPQTILQKRLKNRGNQDIDETLERAEAMKHAYDILRTQKDLIKRIAHTKWYTMDGSASEETVCREALYRVKKLMEAN